MITNRSTRCGTKAKFPTVLYDIIFNSMEDKVSQKKKVFFNVEKEEMTRLKTRYFIEKIFQRPLNASTFF